MKLEKELAKNGEYTLKINDKYIYSRYSPKKDAQRWIEKQVDLQAQEYIVVGFGLGYHLEALLEVVESKSIQVLSLFHEHEKFKFDYNVSNVRIASDFTKLNISVHTQILIPQVWLSLISKEHPLYSVLNDIKMKQVSFSRFSEKMASNFQLNLNETYTTLSTYKDSVNYVSRKAFLVSSGPSLNDTIKYVKKFQSDVFILSVGSALKVLLAAGIVPDAVIVSDCQDQIYKQIKGTQYRGDLFFLSTANHLTVSAHLGRRILLLQSGYNLSEQYALKQSEVVLETGGSVATTAFSLLEELGFQEVYLFGQDLAITDQATHAVGSTSKRELIENEKRILVEANFGGLVQSLPNLLSYLNWFEQKLKKSSVMVYNTAQKGAVIRGAMYLDLENIYKKT